MVIGLLLEGRVLHRSKEKRLQASLLTTFCTVPEKRPESLSILSDKYQESI